MLDRSQSPEIQQIKNLKLPQPELIHLDSGIPVHVINMGTQDIVKIEVVFNAGRPFEDKKLVARTTAALLKEGTKSYTSAEIAEEIDFYGDTLSIPVNLDTSNVILYSLTKHLDKVLPLLGEVLNSPIFPQPELNAFVDRSKQRLSVDLTRNDVVAYRKITEFIFGEDHPYGYNSSPETYEALTRADLLSHFKNKYIAENCRIFISGKVNDALIKSINRHLGQAILRGEKSIAKFQKTHPKAKPVFIPSAEDSVQTAVRIGCHLYNRTDPDYKGMYVLNTILGGYFGSRLMTNIREDKGYTYNIFSTLDSMLFDGCFYVGTEVGNEFVEKTLKEIYHEFDVLQQDLVEEDELKMVQNYLLGNVLTSLDGPFNVADVAKTLIIEGLPLSDFDALVEGIRNITAEEIRDLARKHLNRENMWEVIVGAAQK